MENKTGLKVELLKEIQEKILAFPNVKKVLIFGSRARGDYKKYSDIDLAVFGEQVNLETVGEIRGLLE